MKHPISPRTVSLLAPAIMLALLLLPATERAAERQRQFDVPSGKYGDARFSAMTSSQISGRTIAQVIAFMDTLHMLYPEVVSERWSLGQSHEGRDIWCFRMSDDPGVDHNRPSTLFDALHHPGEWPGTELDIRLAEYLAKSYGSDPLITYLLQHREVYFVPIVNPDGRAYTEDTGNSWPKKNRRDNGDGTFGVNLNDNYPYMWGVSGVPENDSTWSGGYRGPYAGSEPETQAIMGLVNSHDFVTHQSYHTPGNITFYPWAYTSDPTPDDAIFQHMAERMTMLNGYAHRPVSGYSVFSGPTIDWSYGAQGEHEKVFAFTNEVASNGQGTLEQQLQQILDENVWAAIYLIKVAGPCVSASAPEVIGGDSNGVLDPGESAGLSFTIENEGVRKDAVGVKLSFSCDDPYLELHEATRDVGTIAAFSSADLSASPVSVTLDASCPAGRCVNLKVTATYEDETTDVIVPYVVGGPVVLFGDDFESGTDGWTLTGSWGLTSSTSNSPTSSLTDSPGGDYTEDDTSYAALADPITAASLDLSFWQLVQTEEQFDYINVQASADGGPWTTLYRSSGYNGGWSHVEIPLDDYVGAPVRIRFELQPDWSFNDDGWYIDDVTLSGSEMANETPTPPEAVSPAPGEETCSDPVLRVANTTDPDGAGPLTYGFRVYSDSLCTELVAAADGLAEGSGQTEWEVPSLPEGVYWWRAYAADPIERGLLGSRRAYEKTPGPACSLAAPETLPGCLSEGNNLTATTEGATGYEWSLSGQGWEITAGQGTDTITYSAGEAHVPGSFKIVVTSAGGCSDSSEVAFECDDSTTPVELAGFEAAASDEGILLSWLSTGLSDVRRFNVHRSRSSYNGPYVKLNGEPIAAGDDGDRSYSYLDADVIPGTIYFYKLEALEAGESGGTYFGPYAVVAAGTAPSYRLWQNAPNPFSRDTGTTIRYSVPGPARVKITILDAAGRLVRAFETDARAGENSFLWDGTDGAGRSVAGGVYFYEIDAGGFSAKKKMVLVD
jgi:carboxypeptidase T